MKEVPTCYRHPAWEFDLGFASDSNFRLIRRQASKRCIFEKGYSAMGREIKVCGVMMSVIFAQATTKPTPWDVKSLSDSLRSAKDYIYRRTIRTRHYTSLELRSDETLPCMLFTAGVGVGDWDRTTDILSDESVT